MPAIVLAAEQAVIPAWVVDHPSFCRWAFTDEFPQRGRFGYFNDSVWVSFEMETENHNQVKSVITAVLFLLAQARELGRFYGDRMMFSRPTVGLATEPDGMFVSTASRRAGRVVVTRGSGDPGGPVRAIGGWRKSVVFGASFRLTRHTDELRLPTYSLETR